MKNTYVKNTIILSCCLLISKVIGALYRVPLSNILGTVGIGLYQMVFPVYALFLVFITGGMPIYLTQKVSILRAKNDIKSINNLIKNALTLCLLLSIIFALILVFLSKTIANIQGNQDAYLGYITIAISLIFSYITSVYKGYFQGLEYMTPSAICTILEQLFKLVIGLCLAYFLKSYGLIYAVSGAFLGVVFGEIASFVYITFTYYLKRRSPLKTYVNYQSIKKIFIEFLPLSLSGLILPLSSCVDSFLVVNLLTFAKFDINTATSLFGIATGMISPLINFPIILCGTICISALPTLSYNLAKNKNISNLVGGTYLFVWVLAVPCVLGILALAPNIISILFPAIEQQYLLTTRTYLAICCFEIIWSSIAQVSQSIINSYGKFKIPLFSQIVGFMLKVVCLTVLILNSNINILALAIALNLSQMITCFINLFYVKKLTKIKTNYYKLFMTILNGSLMFVLIWYLNKFIILNNIIKTTILTFIGVIIYLILIIFTNVINISQIKQLFNNKKNVKN